MTYSPRYRLAFTLLNEDAASGNAAMSWDVQEAIQSESASPDLLPRRPDTRLQNTSLRYLTSYRYCTTSQLKAKSSSMHRLLLSLDR